MNYKMFNCDNNHRLSRAAIRRRSLPNIVWNKSGRHFITVKRRKVTLMTLAVTHAFELRR